LPAAILPGAKAVVTPAVANLKATRTYVFYLNGQRIPTGSARTLQTFASDDGSAIYAIETLRFANKKVLLSRTKTVTIQPAAPTYLWSQEFNDAAGTAPNSNYFNLQSPYGNGDGTGVGNPGWGNNEREWYQPQNAATDGQGNLVLTATKATASDHLTCYYGACTWKSAKLVTIGKLGFKYGRLEIRAKLSGGQGQWPALWMLGANQPDVGWPQCGEIDIAEWKGDIPNTLWGTLHGPGYLNQGRTTTIDGGLTGYHTYRIDWQPDSITWFLDGVQYHQMTASDIGANTWVFNAEQYLNLNIAMGGNFVGNQIGAGVTSTTMSIDYIHYSQLNGFGQVILH
jgi:beta-glucanase (GH16 family)